MRNEAGFLEIPAELYDIPLTEASRYRKGHRTDPDLPIPGTLIPAHPPKEGPNTDMDASAQDEEEFVVPKDFKVPIAKEGQSELVTTLKVADIHPFEGHPFNVVDNKDMWDLVESVKRYGVLEPVMVINRTAGGYEMVSGHRRMRACQLAGSQTIPTIVRTVFCPHKVEALLYWQLKEGIADPSLLHTAQPAGNALDLEAAQGVCRAVREALAAQLATGLSRMPPVVCETVERMAALCHTAGLPELERALRGLHGEYAAYFARSATYRDAALLQRLSAAFRLAGALEAADGETAPSLAGTFRDDYLPVGGLRLYLLGLRAFSGRSGYAGTIYYFWERDAHQFYTFSHVRPTFYEKEARRRPAAAVPCPLHQAWGHAPWTWPTPGPPGPGACPPPSNARPPCWTSGTRAVSTPILFFATGQSLDIKSFRVQMNCNHGIRWNWQSVHQGS